MRLIVLDVLRKAVRNLHRSERLMMKFSVLILMLGLGTVSGCLGSRTAEFQGQLEPVSGMVTINGVQAAGVEIRFLPQQGTAGTGATAISDEQGRFVLKHRSQQEGVEAGSYRVTFSQFTKVDGSPVGPEEDAALVGVQQIPEAFQHPDKSPQMAEVPTGGKEFQFDLVFKKR